MNEFISPIALPAPLVPTNLDIRRLWWMKPDIGALLNSEFNTMTYSDTAWRAGVTLWMKAWHQVPAGSLPADDRALCHLSGLGRDLRTWRKIKADALHGFTLCDDGRLYHAFLCKMALEAYDEMMRFETRRQRDRDRKAKTGDITPSETTTEDAAGPPEDIGLSDGIPVEIEGQNKTEQEFTPQAPRTRESDRTEVRLISDRPRRQSRRRDADPPERVGIGGGTAEAIVWRNRP
ncbi:MAG: hypothetical protein WCO00_09400 [Rhodospirillaceae bacterium]